MLLMEDRLRGHPLYFDAAKLAMEVSSLCNVEWKRYVSDPVVFGGTSDVVALDMALQFSVL